MKKYKVKVQEIHCDYVEVFANSREEAESNAISESYCQYDRLMDVEIISEEELTNDSL